eukprot:Gb_07272 [translate_table: standard]
MMKILQEFGYAWLLCILILVLPQYGCAAARIAPEINEKEVSLSHHQLSQHLKREVKITSILENPHSKRDEKKTIKDDGIEEAAVNRSEAGESEDLEIIEGRDLIEHIDYAGATTHPPIEPPKKKKPSKPKSLRPPSRAH